MSSCLSNIVSKCSTKKKTKQTSEKLKKVGGFPWHPFLPVFPFFYFSNDVNFLKENILNLFTFTKGSIKMF